MKLKRRIEHRFAATDAQFTREMGVLLGPSILEGNHVTPLQNGREIFPAMLEAIRGATRSITFETYIYWSGDIGREFSEALAERARAGVPVHVTIDWAGSAKMNPELLERMRHAGAHVERYRPLSWYSVGRLNNRTHRKILVVDGRVGFTGGVGIADQWQGDAEDERHWRDSHFRLEGPAVAQLQAAFIDNWIKMTGEVLGGDRFFPPLARAGSMGAQVFIASPAGGSESMHLMYLMAVGAAERSIDLAASYFVPDELLLEALVAARSRGVAVRVLLPGEHTDSDATRLASRASWRPLLEAGVEIHEYQPTMMHTKMLVVDRAMTSVGSTNVDIRSFRLNDEASLNVHDRGFAETMTEVFERDLRRAERYTLERWLRRPRRERILEAFVQPLRAQL